MPDDLTRDAVHALPISERRRSGLFRTSFLLALVNLLSRLLGYAADAIKAHYFGASAVVDAFNVAALVPTLLNDLLIQSLVNGAYIPIFSKYHNMAHDELWRLLNALLNVTVLIFAAITLLMELLAPSLIALLNGGASAAMQALTVRLMHVTIPVLFVLNFSGIATGLLYARQRVILPAVAGMIFNGAALASAVLLQARLGIFALALGLLLGSLLQVAAQLYGLRGAAWPYRLMFWHPGLRRIAGLYLPILLGLLTEIFFSRPLTYALASQAGEGGIAWLGYALSLRQLPEGLIAAALSISVLVRLSATTQQNREAFRETLAEGLRLAFILIIPAGVGLFLLAYPITALLFEHGNFTAVDTGIVAQALRWYVLGLPFATVDLLLVVAYYARRNTLTPALIGLLTTLVYVGLSKALLPVMGLYSLMLADSTKFALHTVLSLLFLSRSIGDLGNLGVYPTLRRSILAAVVMGVVVSVTAAIMPFGETLLSRGLGVLVAVASGLLTYVAMLTLLGVDELHSWWRIIRVRHFNNSPRDY